MLKAEGMPMGVEELLEGLTQPQRQAVTHVEGPLLVLAGPGSGKTRVITHRAAYLAATVTQARHILAITFTNKAAREMAERLGRLTGGAEVTCSTFHAFCARLLRRYGKRVGLGPDFSIYDEADQLAVVREAINRCDLSMTNFPPSGMLELIGRAKNDTLSPQALAEQAGNWQDKVVARVYEAYDRLLTEQNAADFDDLLLKTAKLLQEHEDIREQLEEQYRYVLVDEYQDTNIAQYLIARLLVMRAQNLCATGDPDQSIYAWRGANIENILRFEEDFPNAVVVRLEQNYRSTPQILRVAGAVIRRNRARKEKGLWTENSEGPAVRAVECENAQVEGAFIAEEIARHVEAGGRYGDAAVFYRVNSLSRAIEMALSERRIPYQVARGVAFFQRKEIKDVLAYLKVVANPLDQVAFLRIVNTPSRGIGEVTARRIVVHAGTAGCSLLEAVSQPEDISGASKAARHLAAFAQLMKDIAGVAARGWMRDTVEYAVRHSGLIAMWSQGQNDEALANAEELINAAAQYDHQHPDGGGSLSDWLEQISLVSDVDAVDESTGAVTLMTLHAAKGLEFDTVYVAGVEHGLLPHQRSEKEHGGLEEERRLCFVGMTRARRQLVLSWAKWREVHGIMGRTAKSVFLSELPREEVVWRTVDADGDCHDPDSGSDDESPCDAIEWRVGQWVRHPTLGVGRLLQMERFGRGMRAVVDFREHGRTSLIVDYAHLTPFEMDDPGYDE